MSMLYLFLALLLACGILIEWKLNGFEIVSPVSLMLLGLALADVLAMVGRGSWNSYDLSLEIFLITSLGACSLVVGSYFANRIHKFPADGACCSSDVMKAGEEYKIWKYIALCLLMIVILIVRITETYRLAASLGVEGASYSMAAKSVRNATASIFTSQAINGVFGFSFMAKQLFKVASCVSYLAVALLAKAIFNGDRPRIACSSILVLLSWAYVLSTGSRGDILYQVVSLAVCLFITAAGKGFSTEKLTKKYLVYGAILGVVLAVGFWLSSALVGRKTNSGFVEYISFYFGCGIPSLQSLLDSGGATNLFPGIRTFYNLLTIPYKLGLIDEYPIYSLSWLTLGTHSSNVFTGFARYFLDFGWVGLICLSAFASFIMSVFYKYVKQKSSCFLICVAGYLGAYAFDFAREEFLFSRFLSTSTVVWLVLLVALTWFMTTDFSALRSRLVERFAKERN